MIFVAVISDYLLPMCLYNIAWEMLLWLEPDLKSFSTRDVQQKKAELSAPHPSAFLYPLMCCTPRTPQSGGKPGSLAALPQSNSVASQCCSPQ